MMFENVHFSVLSFHIFLMKDDNLFKGCYVRISISKQCGTGVCSTNCKKMVKKIEFGKTMGSE